MLKTSFGLTPRSWFMHSVATLAILPLLAGLSYGKPNHSQSVLFTDTIPEATNAFRIQASVNRIFEMLEGKLIDLNDPKTRHLIFSPVVFAGERYKLTAGSYPPISKLPIAEKLLSRSLMDDYKRFIMNSILTDDTYRMEIILKN